MKIGMCILSLSCFVLISCDVGYKIDPLIHSVSAKTSRDIQKKYQLHACGIGASAMDGVEELSLDFASSKELTIDEARRLLVSCVEIFLGNINSDKKLRLVLMEYPFPPSRISLAIGIRNDMGDSERVPGVLMACRLFKGIVRYETIKEPTFFISADKVFVIHSETYEEAKRIVENETKS